MAKFGVARVTGKPSCQTQKTDNLPTSIQKGDTVKLSDGKTATVEAVSGNSMRVESGGKKSVVKVKQVEKVEKPPAESAENSPYAEAKKMPKEQALVTPDNIQAEAARIIADQNGLIAEKVYEWANKNKIDITKDGHILTANKEKVFDAVVNDAPFDVGKLRKERIKAEREEAKTTTKPDFQTGDEVLTKDGKPYEIVSHFRR